MTDNPHTGRAANCVCKTEAGQRCQDCNHTLRGETHCEVCGRKNIILPENDILLTVQNVSVKQKGEIANG